MRVGLLFGSRCRLERIHWARLGSSMLGDAYGK